VWGARTLTDLTRNVLFDGVIIMQQYRKFFGMKKNIRPANHKLGAVSCFTNRRITYIIINTGA
jgi:hypothetical protein